ncbi:MAG: hypothetical protein JW910_16020 [Anaerolineae bacterium]|nr:hypothetical protein [Anaerolineae bacterium]
MKKRLWLFVVLGGVLAAAALSACGQDTSAPELGAKVDALDDTGDLTPTAEPTSDDEGMAVAQVAFTDQACLNCHTNQDILKALAVEEEETGESLSSGPG